MIETASSISNANLVFNLSPNSIASSQLNVGSTTVAFGSGVNLTLNVDATGRGHLGLFALRADCRYRRDRYRAGQLTILGPRHQWHNGNLILTGLSFSFSDPNL